MFRKIKRILFNSSNIKAIEKSEKAGKTIPPPHFIKQMIVKQYQQKTKYDLLIETGTWRAHMIESVKDNFKNIISIELDKKLYQRAKKRFENYDHIKILNGDSTEILPSVLKDIDEDVIFWLDAHYSYGETAKGDKYTPIIAELDTIFNKKINYVILIDDAREFKGENDYPKLKELIDYIKSKNPKHKIEVKNDIIRVEKI